MQYTKLARKQNAKYANAILKSLNRNVDSRTHESTIKNFPDNHIKIPYIQIPIFEKNAVDIYRNEQDRKQPST